MNKDNNFSGKNSLNSRAVQLLSLGAGLVLICIIFIAAFIGFQPDQLSLSDRYFPSPTAIPTRTSTPTPTPNWTATQQSLQFTATAQWAETMSKTVANEWPLLFSENFDKNNINWNTGIDNDTYTKIARKISQGKYQWNITAKQGFVGWINIPSDYLEDFYLSFDTRKLSGPNTSNQGLLFHQSSLGYYYFHMAESGVFGLDMRFNEAWTTLIEPSLSPAIQPGETNRLAVIAQGNYFMFFINDQFVASIYNTKLNEGSVDMAVGFDKGDEGTIEFDNIELHAP